MKKVLLNGVLACLAVCLQTGRAELTWNALSAKIFAGPSQNGGRTSDAGWEHEYEYGGSGIMALNEMYEVELAFSKWNVKNRDVSTYWEDRANKIALSGRRKYFFPSLFVPWWEAGLDMALIDTYKRNVQDNENHSDHTDEYSLSAFGAHIGAGVDIYPLDYSALALTINARYTYFFTTSDINGPEILFGLRWDFFQRGLNRRNYKRVDAGDRKPLQRTPEWLR
jgi:hypothetical protein